MSERTVCARAARRFLTALLPLCALSSAGYETGPGRITLKSGDVILGDVVKSFPESYIVRTAHGLKVLSRGVVDNIEAGAELPPDTPPPSDPPSTPPGGGSPGRAPDKSGPGDRSESPGPEGRPGQPEAKPAARSLPDRRLDAARAGGTPPVLEIAISGAVDGKPLGNADPFTLSRLTYFFREVSRPRFNVLPPRAEGSPSGKTAGKASAPGGAAPSTPAAVGAEYRAEVVGQAGQEDLTFFGTQVLKTFRSKVTLRLVRLADKKVVEELEVVEDEGGDPSKREELCRRAYNQGVEALVKGLKDLRSFGVTSAGSDNVKTSSADARS